jgi:hypothetical protein
MNKIVFVSDKLIPITVRIKNSTLNDLDKATESIGKILGEELSRNTIAEQMIEYAKSNAVFELDGKSYTFEDLLKYEPSKTTEVNSDNTYGEDIKSLTEGENAS